MKVFNFYLRNYQVVHHIFTLLAFGMVFWIGGLNLLDPKNFLIYSIPMLVICYVVTIMVLKITGLGESIEKEKNSRGI